MSLEQISDLNIEKAEPPKIEELKEIGNLLDEATAIAAKEDFKSDESKVNRLNEIVEDVKSKKDVISNGLAFPEHLELISETCELLSHNFLKEVNPELDKVFLSILHENAEVLDMYASGDEAVNSVNIMGLARALVLSKDFERSNIGLDIIESALNTQKEDMLFVTEIVIENSGNGELFSPYARNKLAKILEKHKDGITRFINSDNWKMKKAGIELCLAGLGYVPKNPYSLDGRMLYQKPKWVDEALIGNEDAVLSCIEEKAEYKGSVPDSYLSQIRQYYIKNSNIRSMIDNFVEDTETKKAQINFISSFCGSEDATLENLGGIFLNNHLKKYGLEKFTDVYLDAWQQGAAKENLKIAIGNNLITIYNLESSNTGISERLTTLQGIKHFSRYPTKLLLDQDEIRNRNDIKYGCLLFPETDYNGYFYSLKPIVEDLYEQLESGKKNYPYYMRVFEGGQKRDIARLVKKVTDRYGPMSFAVIGAHGSKFDMNFGNHEEGTIEEKDLRNIRPERHNFFTKDASMVLISCSTGNEDESETPIKNIADAYRRAFGIEVKAPKVPTSVKSITPEYKDNGIDLSVEYLKGTPSIYAPIRSEILS